MIQAPIFHVNGDDPEAVVRVARLAFEYRQAFNKDVVIDLVCYRRRGHNEGDDPSMTNPQMYQIIDSKRSVRKLYTEELIGRGDITVEDAEELLRDYQAQLERVFKATRDAATTPRQLSRPTPAGRAGAARSTPRSTPPWSGPIGEAHVNLPEGFTPHKRIQQLLDRRAKMSVEGDIDWGFGEIIAFGSLLHDRGHRPAGRSGLPPRHVRAAARLGGRRRDRRRLPAAVARWRRRAAPGSSCTTRCCSEYAAMGFEYGYSVENPDALVLLGGAVRRLRQRRPVDRSTSSSPPAR